MVNYGPQTDKDLSYSRFYMWRAMIALAHIDGDMAKEERAYLTRIIGNMSRAYRMTDEQKETFAKDLDHPQKFSDMLSHINEPDARADLIYFGWILARMDGIVTPDEEAVLKKLRADQMANVDMDALRQEIHTYIEDEMFKHDLKISEIRSHKGVIGALDVYLQEKDIDIFF